MPAATQSRLVTRIPSALRQTLQSAADLEGTSLNQFLIQAAYRHAQEVLDRETILHLNRQQTQRVFELLEHPPKPNAALRAAKRLHGKLVRA